MGIAGGIATVVILWEVYQVGKDWYDRTTEVMKKKEAAKNVADRIDQSNANNSSGGKFCPTDGKTVTSVNPLTGNPYIIDQINQYHRDIASNVPDAFTVADPTPFLPGGAYENGKAAGRLAH
ncbi:MAG: hypothetical protein PHU06_14290 [Gallionella sp.]|nr:hypothetical protein [Gallionella sp.]MDD4960547.1 hypothetical protein [Gallionella sp.]